MKRFLLTAAVLASTLLPVTASASDRYHGGHSGGYGSHYSRGYSSHGYYRGGSSFSFSFGLFGGSRYYAPAYSYYRPVYRPYCPPPIYYYDAAPVYVPAPVYVAPRRYYYDDCDYYYRPSSSLSFSYGRYYYR